MEQSVEEDLEEIVYGDTPVIHLVCCRSNKLALCKKDLKGHLLEKEAASSCVECIEIDNEHPPVECYIHNSCILTGDRLL